MSLRDRWKCHSLSDDSEEASGNHADPGPEPEPEELDWDSYSTTMEHRLAAVGNWRQFVATVQCGFCLLIKTICLLYSNFNCTGRNKLLRTHLLKISIRLF